MRVARAAFFAGPALLLVAVLAMAASFVADRRHARRRVPVVDDDVDVPMPAPRRWAPPARALVNEPPPLPPDEPERRDSLRLRVDGPHGLRLRSISVELSPAGDDDEAETATTEVDAGPDGSFVIDGLVPGSYDLTIFAAGLADAHLTAVPSDAAGVHVTLARPAVLIGAVGEGGGGCAALYVSARQAEIAEDEEQTEVRDVDDDCTFSVEGLARGRPVGVRVGPGRGGEVSVGVPSEGDPPPLCLAPPCAFLPSALVVLLADGDGFLANADVSLSWTTLSDDGGGGGVTSGARPAVIAGLPAGARVHLHATVDEDDRGVETDVVVPFGVTEVVLTLPAAQLLPLGSSSSER